MYDGSGLSRDNRVAVATLVQVLQAAADPDQPALRAVVSTLPVAGFSGSLDYRFVAARRASVGAGQDGTLTGVHGLAGWWPPQTASRLCLPPSPTRCRSGSPWTPGHSWTGSRQRSPPAAA